MHYFNMSSNTHESYTIKFGPPHNHQANPTKIEVSTILQAKTKVTPMPKLYEEDLVKTKIGQTTPKRL